MIWVLLYHTDYTIVSEGYPSEADKELTVIMCPQIFDWMIIAPSSGNFCRRPPLGQACRQDQQFRKKYFLVNGLVDPFCGRGRNSARGSLREFFISCPPYVEACVAGVIQQIQPSSYTKINKCLLESTQIRAGFLTPRNLQKPVFQKLCRDTAKSINKLTNNTCLISQLPFQYKFSCSQLLTGRTPLV